MKAMNRDLFINRMMHKVTELASNETEGEIFGS
jgi:hypothetical protein